MPPRLIRRLSRRLIAIAAADTFSPMRDAFIAGDFLHTRRCLRHFRRGYYVCHDTPRIRRQLMPYEQALLASATRCALRARRHGRAPERLMLITLRR